MIKKLLSITVILSILCTFLSLNMGFTVSGAAKEYKEGYYTYTVTDGKATIEKCDKAISGDITIPDKLGGYPVEHIGYKAFSTCNSLKSITFPNSINFINDYAFYQCKELSSIIIPDSVRTIGANTFSYCEQLTDVKLPANLKKYLCQLFHIVKI